MKNRYFWEKATFKKFKIIFETNDFIHGRDINNRFRTFRKDTGLISFKEREILEIRLAELAFEKEIDEDEKIYSLRGRAKGNLFGLEFA